MSRAGTCAVIAALVAGWPFAARADDWRLAGHLALELDGVRAGTRHPGDLAAAGLAGPSGWILAGHGHRLGYLAGFAVHLGAGRGGGFAYDARLAPVGLGLELGPYAYAGLALGLGTSGVTGREAIALDASAEVFALLELGRHLELGGYGRLQALHGAAARERPGDDVREAGCTVRLGRGAWDERQSWGNGYVVGLGWRDAADGDATLFTIGYAITARYLTD